MRRQKGRIPTDPASCFSVLSRAAYFFTFSDSTTMSST